MSIRIASSNKPQGDVIADLTRQFLGIDPNFVIYFASSHYDAATLASAWRTAYPSTEVMGCTTAGEFVSGRAATHSVVAMAFDRETLPRVATETVTDLNDAAEIERCLARLAKAHGCALRDLDMTRHVGVILIDGLSGAEERVMDTIGNLTDLTFVGGSAGDDLAFSRTMVSAGGHARARAAVLAILECANGFDLIKTQSFDRLGKTLVATEVDEAARTVAAFGGERADVAYARAVGVPTAEAGDHFMRHPLGVMVDDEPYVRSPQRVVDGAMVFYCNIKEGMALDVLTSTDIVADTARELRDKLNGAGRVQGLLNFHCILRTLELMKSGTLDDYAGLFTNVPSIGFSTYGEQYVGHINQTSTMLLIR